MKKLLILAVAVLFFGCDAAKPVPREPGSQPASVVAEPPKAEVPPVAEEKKPEVEPETVRVKADIGMTGKGQYNDGGGEKPTDILTVPISQMFLAKERIALQALQHSENLYKAEHDGKLPATHEEYMEKVAAGTGLPKLPEGHQYVYDPEKQQLMVEKPK